MMKMMTLNIALNLEQYLKNNIRVLIYLFIDLTFTT